MSSVLRRHADGSPPTGLAAWSEQQCARGTGASQEETRGKRAGGREVFTFSFLLLNYRRWATRFPQRTPLQRGNGYRHKAVCPTFCRVKWLRVFLTDTPTKPTICSSWKSRIFLAPGLHTRLEKSGDSFSTTPADSHSVHDTNLDCPPDSINIGNIWAWPQNTWSTRAVFAFTIPLRWSLGVENLLMCYSVLWQGSGHPKTQASRGISFFPSPPDGRLSRRVSP